MRKIRNCAALPSLFEEAFIKKSILHDALQVGHRISGSGYGLFTASSIAPGTEILRVPNDVYFPYSATHAVETMQQTNKGFYAGVHHLAYQTLLPNHPLQAESLVKATCMAINLMKRDSSCPYVNLLRESSYPINPKASPHPLLIEEQLHQIDHLLSYTKVHRDIEIRRNTYFYIADSIFGASEHSHILSTNFKWAISMVLSRFV